MIDRLDIRSGLSRSILYETSYMQDDRQIREELDRIEYFRTLLRDSSRADGVDSLRVKLERLKDIRNTIAALQGKHTLDDIQLFEIKGLALLNEEINELLAQLKIDLLEPVSLKAVVGFLDPDKNRIPSFYIYDSYSAELASLRKALKKSSQEDAGYETIYARCEALEDRIRTDLCIELRPYSEGMLRASAMLAHLDLLLAKARQAIDLGLCKPAIDTQTISYRGLFNPEIREALAGEGKTFQAVDITLEKRPILITGANMTGKSVVLKTVALAQALFQFGFYVPAAEARIVVVEDILFSMGDDQDALKGLSSFAAEMSKIDRIVREVKLGKRLLVLVDEPARTTNPTEGKALVNALLELLDEYRTYALLTTHYSGIRTSGRKLRVKGIPDDLKSGIAGGDINRLIDYSLIEDTGEEVPHEAVRIARILGVDEDLLRRTEKYLM